jgi:hypothetical protein
MSSVSSEMASDGDLIHSPEPTATWAGALRSVGRELLRTQHWVSARVIPGP